MEKIKHYVKTSVAKIVGLLTIVQVMANFIDLPLSITFEMQTPDNGQFAWQSTCREMEN